MQRMICGGDVVTMNPAREVLVGGAVRRRRRRDRRRSARRRELRPRHPRRRGASTPAGCVVTPGMINAHQHLTGDPLVRSCIPDLLPPGASIFEWSVPLHGAHEPRRRRAVGRRCRAVEAAAQRRHDGRRGRHGRPSRPGRRRARRPSGCAARSARGDGTSRTGPFTAPADEVLDRQRAVVDAYPAGGLGRGVGHARRPRPRLRRAAGRRRRPRPRARHRA